MGYLLFRGRLGAAPIQRLLLALGLCMVGWHASNLLITIHGLLGLEISRWVNLLRAANATAVISITVCYSLLLHVHLHLWANAHSRGLTQTERIRIYLSYIPCLFLFFAVPRIWSGNYQPMIVKLSAFVLPFALWVAYTLAVVSFTELLVARCALSVSERRILRTLAFSFIVIAVLILGSLGFGLGKGTVVGLYLETIANLGSLLPSVLLAYYIYRYRYLELIIEESLIVATFAAVVLTIYIYGIRTIGDWITSRYGVREGVVEALLILGLTLAAAPLRGWLEKRFHKLFEREAALYRQIVSRIGSHAGQYKQLPELLHFVEARTTEALGLRRVQIVVSDRANAGDTKRGPQAPEDTVPTEPWLNEILAISNTGGWCVVEDAPVLTSLGFRIAYPLRREDRIAGMLLIDGASGSLTPDARAVLEILAGQVAIAIEDCRLVEENVRLERRLA